MPKLIPGLRNRIIENALFLLSSEGLDGFSIRKIANRCGISVGTVYNYFPTKHSIAKAIFKTYIDDFRKQSLTCERQEYSLQEKIRALYCEFRKMYDAIHDIFLNSLENDFLAEAVRNKKNRRMLIFLALHIQEIVERDRTAAACCNKRGIPAKTLALFISTSFFGMVHTSIFEYSDFEILLTSLLQGAPGSSQA